MVSLKEGGWGDPQREGPWGTLHLGQDGVAGRGAALRLRVGQPALMTWQTGGENRSFSGPEKRAGHFGVFGVFSRPLRTPSHLEVQAEVIPCPALFAGQGHWVIIESFCDIVTTPQGVKSLGHSPLYRGSDQ